MSGMIRLKSQQAEDRGTVTTVELAGDGFGDDVAEVELGGALVEVDGFDLFSMASHGVARRLVQFIGADASVTELGREHLTSKQPLARPVVSKRRA